MVFSSGENYVKENYIEKNSLLTRAHYKFKIKNNGGGFFLVMLL
jgi:hypothetical protein